MKPSFTLTPFLFFLLFSISATGQLLNKTITVDGQEREYLLYVPGTYDGSEEWPLVLNLHGRGGTSQFQMSWTGMNALADTEGFLLAYPQGAIPVPGFPGFEWNVTVNPNLVDDVQFISSLIDAIAAEYEVDLTRVYSTGLSNGGYMSAALACELSDKIAAVASVAGPRPLAFMGACEVNRPFPILFMHGTDDPVIPFEGGNSNPPASGIPFPPVREEVQFWLDNNGCSPDSTVTVFADSNTDDNSTVRLITFSDCDAYTNIDGDENSAEVLFYVIENGGHWWPGGAPPPISVGNVNQDINASVEIWNFFSRHGLGTTTAINELTLSDIALRTYPNPVYDQLTIEFELPEAAPVQMTLYNHLGQPLQTLVEGRLAEGLQRVNWETRQLPAGIYYYRLRIGERQVGRPVVVMERK